MIYLVGGALAFFFEFMLLGKKNKTLPDKLLAVWMFLIGIHLLLYYFLDSGLARKYPFILGISAPFPFFHGPMLFLYTSALTGRIERVKTVMMLHFLPVAGYYLYALDFFLMPGEEQWEFVRRIMDREGPVFYTAASYAILVSAATYQVITLTLFRRHKRKLMDQFSYTSEKINLNWLRYLIIGMSVIWVAVIISYLQIIRMEGDDLIYLTVVLFVVFIGYFGVRQGNIFESVQTVRADTRDHMHQSDEEKRYLKSGLKKEVADETESRLKELMEKEKLFLDDSLSLGKIADLVGLSPTYLSQVINERFGKNFYDFVNSHRVEEFKRMLNDPVKKNYSILSLAYEAGFNSKSSFNKYFKQTTGKTPSEFMRSAS